RPNLRPMIFSTPPSCRRPTSARSTEAKSALRLMRSRRRVAPDGLQSNSLATEQGVSKYVSGNLSRNTECNRRSLISGLSLDLLVSAFPLVGAPTKWLIKKICSWVLAIRDYRAASCLRIRDGKFRAAAILEPRGRRNHQAPWKIRKLYREAIGAFGPQPFFHFFGNRCGSADHCKSGVAAEALRELPHGKLFT